MSEDGTPPATPHDPSESPIVQINGRDGEVFTAPPATAIVGEGDAVVLIGRPNRSAVLTSLFEPRTRAGVRG